MKITHNKVGTKLNISDSGSAKGSDKASAASKLGGTSKTSSAGNAIEGEGADSLQSAQVNLSSKAQNIKKATEIAKAAPDIRSDRVAELQKQIDAGTYKVGADQIADKMVDEELLWS